MMVLVADHESNSPPHALHRESLIELFRLGELEQPEHEAGVKVRHDGGTNSAFRLPDEDEYIPGLAIEEVTELIQCINRYKQCFIIRHFS